MIIDFNRGSIDPSIAVDVNNLKSSAYTGVEYVSSAATINFKDLDGNIVGSIDASDFIIDGMVEDVYLSGNTLVIDFNTESGQQDIEIDLTDFINPDLYYTSAQTDTLILNAKNDVYASATTYTDGQVSALTAHLEDVEQVTASALTDLNNRVVALSAASVNFITSSDIADFVTSGDVETQITNKNYITSADTADFITSGYVETAITHMVKSPDDSVINVIKISQAGYDALVAQSATSETTLYVIIS